MTKTLSKPFACKARNLQEVKEQVERAEQDEFIPCVVRANKRLTAAQYDVLASNLFSDAFLYLHTFQGGRDRTSTEAVQVMRITSPGRRALLVNPEGYGYARYVAFA